MLRSLILLAFALTTLWQHPTHAADVPVGASFDSKTNIAYPASHAIVDVTKAPYFAKGDGRTDDTAAIQKALHDVMGLHKIVYLPAGTYLVSQTIHWSKKNAAGKDAWGMNFIQGQNVAKTSIRLKDSIFTDPQTPQSIMWCGGFGSADWFHNYIQDVTFDVGDKNPGAIGLQFYSNNSGAVRNCRFIAGEGSGAIGLDLGHRDVNGPLLVRNCEVIGFRRGISTEHAVNGQTFEHITLRGQTQFGFENQGQTISIRDLVSENSVPAIQSYGTLCLLDAKLTGREGAAGQPAIINYNGGRIFLRDITTTGYGRALGDVTTPDSFAARRLQGPDKPGSEGPNIAEYCSQAATSPFPSAIGSLRLTVKEPPEVPIDDPKSWANVDKFGADPTGQQDSSAAIQKAMDSGATTVFLPGFYALHKTVVIRGKVRRVVGVGGWVDYNGQAKPDFRIVDGASPVVLLEHFSNIHGGLEIDTRRTVVLCSVSDCDLTNTRKSEGGELFLEDVVTHNLKLKKQQVWARQLNIENEGMHFVNDNSALWILGYKTERGGTLLKTRGGGRSEVLGGFSYTTTAGKLAPMFVTEDSAVFTFFNEVCFNGDPFETLIQESRQQKTKVIKRSEGGTTPYLSNSNDADSQGAKLGRGTWSGDPRRAPQESQTPKEGAKLKPGTEEKLQWADLPRPKGKEAQSLFKKWQEGTRANGNIPGGALGPLVRVMTNFIKNNPTHEGAPKFAELLKRIDLSHDWTPADAVALLDEVTAIYANLPEWVEGEPRFTLGGAIQTGKPLPDELKNAPWGEAQPNGLRVAWLLEPRALKYRLGTPLKSRILFHNAGKDVAVFRALTFNQSGSHKAHDANGEEINIVSTYWTTIPQTVACRLAPGEFMEVTAPGIGVGVNKDNEDWRGTRVGSWIETKEGDEVTFTPAPVSAHGQDVDEALPNELLPKEPKWWLDFITDRLSLDKPLPADAAERKRLLDRATRDLFGNAPTPEEITAFTTDAAPDALDTLAKRLASRAGFAPFSGSLKSGTRKFLVLPVDPEAAKKPRTAKNPGQYMLGGNATLVVVRRPVGERIVNDAHIAFTPTDAAKQAPREPHPVPLPDGYDTWVAAWVRGETVMWVMQNGNVRSYDFTTPAKVKETQLDEADFDKVPKAIMETLSAGRGSTQSK